MPGPLHPCPRCRRALLPQGQTRCPACERKHQKADVLYRGTATDRGYDSRWRKLAGAYRKAHPECEERREGCTGQTQIVDHVSPHRGDPDLLYSWANLQAMCRACHGRKTHSEGPGYRARAGTTATPVTPGKAS